jgi:hypothetical protein
MNMKSHINAMNDYASDFLMGSRGECFSGQILDIHSGLDCGNFVILCWIWMYGLEGS